MEESQDEVKEHVNGADTGARGGAVAHLAVKTARLQWTRSSGS